MDGFSEFFAAHLLLPAVTLAITLVVVTVGRARRRWVGARATPPPIAPPRAKRAARHGAGAQIRKSAMRRMPGTSAARQRSLVTGHRVGY